MRYLQGYGHSRNWFKYIPLASNVPRKHAGKRDEEYKMDPVFFFAVQILYCVEGI